MNNTPVPMDLGPACHKIIGIRGQHSMGGLPKMDHHEANATTVAKKDTTPVTLHVLQNEYPLYG
jgi:hypothetical protein